MQCARAGGHRAPLRDVGRALLLASLPAAVAGAALLPTAAGAGAPEAAPDAGGQQTVGFVLDRIVAVVDAETVTQAELAGEARLALVRRAPDARAAAKVVPDEDYLQTFLTFLLDQMLVAREARRVGAEESSAAEVEVLFTALADSFGADKELDDFLLSARLTPTRVRDILRRELTNERYLNQRLRTRLAGNRVSKNGPPQNAAQALKAFLPAYLRELRQSVMVRRMGKTGRLEREGAG